MINNKETFVAGTTFLRRALKFRNFLIVVTLGFAILTLLAKKYDYFNLDLVITLFIQKYNQVWFDMLMKFVTFTGNVTTVVVLVILLSLYGYLIGKRHVAILIIVSTIGGMVISQILKILIGRPRPDPLLVHQIGHFLKSDSFPSGHVFTAVSLYGLLLYIIFTQLKKSLFRKILIGVCLMIISLMGISRIYLGAHWFSDVLGAYLIGFVWVSGIIFIHQKLRPKVK